MPGRVPRRVHDLDLETGETQHVAVGDRPEVLRPAERVVEAGAPGRVVGERVHVRLVHEHGHLAGEIPAVAPTWSKCACVARTATGASAAAASSACTASGENPRVDDHGLVAVASADSSQQFVP